MDFGILDKLHIRDIQCRCVLGVFAEERHEPREVSINLTIYYNKPKAAKTDNIDQAVDYDELTKKLRAHVEPTTYELIESLAESIANLLLENPSILACLVVVDKHGVPEGARSAAVEIFRKRKL